MIRKESIACPWLHLYPMADLSAARSWYPVVLSRAKGSYYYDTQGGRYFDMISGAFCCSFGHSRPEFIDAWQRAASRLSYVSPFSHYSPDQSRLAGELASAAHQALGDKWQVFFVNSGSEGIECSLNIVDGYKTRAAIRRTLVAGVKGSYHGTTTGARQLSSFDGLQPNVTFRSEHVVTLPGVAAFPTNAGKSQILDAFDSAIARATRGRSQSCDLLAVLVEPVENCAGNHVMTTDYASAISDLQKKCSVIVIADEVITGMGRLGGVFSSHTVGLSPDILVLGKGLTGGHESLGAVIVRSRLARIFHGGGDCLQHGATFGGRPPACRVAMKALALLARGSTQARYKENVYEIDTFTSSIASAGSVLGVTGAGMLRTLHLSWNEQDMCALHRQLVAHGIISCIYPERGMPRLEIAPPITTDPRHLRKHLATYVDLVLAMHEKCPSAVPYREAHTRCREVPASCQNQQ